MSGVLKVGREGGYIIHAFGSPIILLDKNHAPTQQYLKAFGKEMLGQKIDLVVTDQFDNYWRAQIAPEELKSKGFSRSQERQMGRN
ncbi:hypothetical protein K8R43_01100 [archaeon]|nr:hypothetical protein [archaeon]